MSLPEPYVIARASGASGIAGVFDAVGFRDDLVDDIEFVRALGIGESFVALCREAVVGASSCVSFGATGWVGGVAVLPDHTRRGLGTQLTRAALDALQRRGARSILLHATSDARILYSRLGFQATGELVELHRGPTAPRWTIPVTVRRGTPADLPSVLQLDQHATGEDRAALLEALWPERAVVVDGPRGLLGFGLRQSARGSGAVVALDSTVGEGLVVACAAATPVAERIALPSEQTGVRRLAEGHGYHEVLRTTRMLLGAPIVGRGDCLFGVFNLYWG